jgi:hypothetical protein
MDSFPRLTGVVAHFTVFIMEPVLDQPWQNVAETIDRNHDTFLQQRTPTAENFDLWLAAVDLLRQAEEDRLVMRQPSSEDLTQHRVWLTSLIAEGERLMSQTRGIQTIAGAAFTLNDVKATLEMLYLSQREWHGSRLSEARRREILKTVFHVAESAA